jgi:hypothetical protein
MLSVSERITSNLTVIHGAGNSPRFEVVLGPLDCSACKRAIEQGELVWMRPERTSTRSLYNVPTCNECTKQVLTGDVYQAPRPAAVLTPEGKQKVREAIAACSCAPSNSYRPLRVKNLSALTIAARQRMREDYRHAENARGLEKAESLALQAIGRRINCDYCGEPLRMRLYEIGCSRYRFTLECIRRHLEISNESFYLPSLGSRDVQRMQYEIGVACADRSRAMAPSTDDASEGPPGAESSRGGTHFRGYSKG